MQPARCGESVPGFPETLSYNHLENTGSYDQPSSRTRPWRDRLASFHVLSPYHEAVTYPVSAALFPSGLSRITPCYSTGPLFTVLAGCESFPITVIELLRQPPYRLPNLLVHLPCG